MEDTIQATDKGNGGLLARASRNGAALFALGGAFIAAALPLAEFVRGVYELKVKEREHADSVELEFLKLLTGDKIAQADRRRVLQVLLVVTSATPLRGWAADEAGRYDQEIAKRQKLAEDWQSAKSQADDKKRAYDLASYDVESKQTELQELIDSHGEVTRIGALQKELGSLQDSQQAAFTAWNASADLATATGRALASAPTPVVGAPPVTAATADTVISVTPLLPVGVTGAPTAPTPLPAQIITAAGRDVVSRVTPDLLRQLFPHASPESVAANGPLLLRALTQAGLSDREMLLVAFVTLAIEDPSLQPNVEKSAAFNTKTTPFDAYEGRSALGNTSPGDGERYRGRGFIWITGRSNYESAARALNMPDLVTNPDLMAQPEIAARAYAWFLASHQARFRQAARDGDFPTIRRLVVGAATNLPAFQQAWDTVAKKFDPPG